MKRALCLLFFALSCSFAFPQGGPVPQYAAFTWTNAPDAAGNLLQSGYITFTPVTSSGGTIAPNMTGGGRVIPLPVTFKIVAGVAYPSYGTMQLVDVTQANPSNFCYKDTIHDNESGMSWSPDSCVQPAWNASWCAYTTNGTTSSTTCDFGKYVPSGTPGALQVAGLPGINWRGAWSAESTYAVNDGVSYNGSSYRSTIAGNLNNNRGNPTTPGTGWAVVAAQGASGLGADPQCSTDSNGHLTCPTVAAGATNTSGTATVGGTSFIDSSSPAYTTLAQACSAAVAAKMPLYVSKAWTSLTTQTCAAPIALPPNGQIVPFQPASGQTITFSKGIMFAGLGQICDTSLGGNANCIFQGVKEIPATWYGADATGAADSTTAFQAWSAALTSVASTYGVSVGVIPPGQYSVNGNAIAFGASNITVRAYGAKITQNGTNNVTVNLNTLGTPNNTGVVNHVRWFGGLFYNSTAAGSNTNAGFLANVVERGIIQDVFGNGFGTAFISANPEDGFALRNIGSYLNARDIYEPSYYNSGAGNNPVHWTMAGLDLSTPSVASIDLEGYINDLTIKDSVFAGATTGTPYIKAVLNVGGAVMNVIGNHFESSTNLPTTYAVQITQPGSAILQFYDDEGNTYAGTLLALSLNGVKAISINSQFQSSYNGQIYFGPNAGKATINGTIDNFFGTQGATMTQAIFYDCPRSNIRLTPEIAWFAPTSFSGYGAVVSTVAGVFNLNPYALLVSGPVGTFQAGETVTGGTSGATSTVVRWESSGDVLRIGPTTGTFQVGETITGATSGATATLSEGTGASMVGSNWTGNSRFKIIPPQAWMVGLQAKDSGSSGSNVYALFAPTSATNVSFQNGLFLQGVTNSVYRSAQWTEPADSIGNFYYTFKASGTSTLTVVPYYIGAVF